MNLFAKGQPHSNLVTVFAQIYKNIKNNQPLNYKSMLIFTGILSSTSMKIWLLDDDKDDCMMFEEAMHDISTNIAIKTFNDTGDFFNTIENTPPVDLPDIVFLDLNLPIMNGKECLVQLKNNEKTQAIPVVIYSTSSHSIDIEDTYNSGATHYISKPSSFKTLQQLFSKVLSIDWDKINRPAFDKFVIKA